MDARGRADRPEESRVSDAPQAVTERQVPFPRRGHDEPEPAAAPGTGESARARGGGWAVCCSGGGIRSASFCLGGLQSLDQGGLLKTASHILGVSGGSYIAASRALVAHGLRKRENDPDGRQAAGPSAYAPGAPEEQNLRDNTHYLLPNATTVLVGVLSMLVGVSVTFVLAFAPLFAIAHAWGWLLRWQQVLLPAGQSGLAPGSPRASGDLTGHLAVSVATWTWWLPPAVLGGLTLVLFGCWWARLAPRPHDDRDRGEVLAGAVARAAFLAVVSAVAMLAVPALLGWLTGLQSGPWRDMANGLGIGPRSAWTPAEVFALVPVVAAIAHSARAKLEEWHLLATPGKSPSSSIASSLSRWIRGALLPWVASLLIILAAAVAGLHWVRDGAVAGYSAASLWPVLAALAVMLGTRILADVNRMSMHDFYRWRIASAFAVMRGPSSRVTPAPGALLSSLRGELPELVICATANINADRQVPVGRGAVSLTFDPEWVRLRGQNQAESARAATSDYEALVGPRRLTLFDVSTISGAAVSPVMGAMTKQAYRVMLTMTNMRLGVWLPHPAVVAAAREVFDTWQRRESAGERGARLRWWHAAGLLAWYVLPHPRWESACAHPGRGESRLWAYVLMLRHSPRPLTRRLAALWYHAMQPTLGMLWAEAIGRTSYRSTWLCATDGGHYDNLALVEALRRGCEDILLLDASGDGVDTWYTLGGAIALARTDAGADIDLDPTAMIRAAGGGPARALAPGEVIRPWAVGTYRRRSGEADHHHRADGAIWICKLGWWQEAPWDVRAYAACHPEFPTDTTLRQLYDGAEFDAYRELGASAVGAAMAAGGLPATPQWSQT